MAQWNERKFRWETFSTLEGGMVETGKIRSISDLPLHEQERYRQHLQEQVQRIEQMREEYAKRMGWK